MSLSDNALVSLTQAKAYLRINAESSQEVFAEYVGVGDDSTVDFVLDHTPIEGSLKLYVNGTLQVEDTDFTLSTATVTFTTAPTLSDPITASYVYAPDSDTFESYDDGILEELIIAATEKAEDYTGRVFVQREIVETRIGDGTQILKLYKQPVVSIDTITIGGTELTTYSQRLSIGRLYHPTIWPEDYEIIVTYTAGYGADRAATQLLVHKAVNAVLLILANLYDNRVDQVKGENTGAGSVTYDLPSKAKELLDPLRAGMY